jgi:hypothetical protein
MPNDCWNDITIITYDTSQGVNNIFDNTLRGADVKVKKRWKNGMELTIMTEWNPCFKWLESLIDTYPKWWLKNEWWEEGGTAGVWVGYHKNDKKIIKKLEWDDICIEELHSRETN